MQPYHIPGTLRRAGVAAVLLALSLVLAACNGSGSSVVAGAAGNSYIRFVGGSPDAGSVDVYVDGSAMVTSAGYGTITPFHRVNSGYHNVTIYAHGSDSGSGLAHASFTTNAATDTSVVLTGDLHPAYQATSNLAVTVFNDGIYNTVAGGAGVNFYHAAPIMAAAAGYNMTTVQFGYSLNSAPSNNPIDSAVGFGGSTNVQTLPGAATNVPLTLYAVNNSTVTIEPGQVSTNCSNNELPCTEPNLTLYLVDGPAASTSPTTPLPSGVSGSARAVFFGVLDANGLLVQ